MIYNKGTSKFSGVHRIESGMTRQTRNGGQMY